MIWKSFAHFILKNRIAILVVIGLFTAFMGYQIRNLKMDYGYAGLLPDSHPVSQKLEEFRKVFGQDANIVLVGIQDPDFFTIEHFSDWWYLRDSLLTINGVDDIQSVTTALNMVKNTEHKMLLMEPVFKEIPKTQEELDSLSRVFHSLPIYRDMVYADSSQVYVMALTMDKDAINEKTREGIMSKVEDFAGHYGQKHGMEIHYSGLPYIRTVLAIMIKHELIKFIVLAAVVLAFVLLIFFRSFTAVFFSLLVVLIGVTSSLGMIAMLNYKITILSGMIPAVIIVIGIPNCVFLLNKYHQDYLKHGNKIRALHRTIERVGNAIFLTNLTTAAGFATFMVIQHRILSRFGQVASLNIMLLFLISITLIPIIFSFLPPPSKRQLKHVENKRIGKIVDRFAWAVIHRRNAIYLTIFLLMVFAGFGITKIKSTGFIVDDIPKSDKVYVDLKFFEKHLNGVMPLEVAIDTRKANGALNLRALKKAEQFQEELMTYPELSRPYSAVDGIKFARQAYFNGSETQYRLPSNTEKNFILSYLAGSGAMNDDLLSSFVDTAFQKLRVNIRVADIGTYGMLALHDSIQNDLNRIFPEDQYDTYITGSSLTFTLGTRYLVRNLFWSLGLAVMLISLFMATMFRSSRMVMISIFPNILPLVFTAGLMGFANIPIKPSTVLVFSVAFGISVDTAIHFLAKYRQELLCPGVRPQDAVINAVKEVGISIVYTVIVLFLGFGIFVASDFGGTVAMGILTSITLFVAVFSNLLLVPSLLIEHHNNKTKDENTA